jgi:predicted alpha/beta-hydrolase family hydrolase
LTEARALFVCAHGAGGHKDDRGMVALARALDAVGFEVVRFNFPYRERGSKLFDPMPVLKESIAATVARVRDERKLIIGGRSMGGRAASMLAADGFQCDGLLLFAYPLHPAGKPEKLRDAHLPQIRVPVLCFNGTRDPLCRRDLMEKTLEKLSWEMHWLEDATHTFRERDFREVADVSREWLSRLA